MKYTLNIGSGERTFKEYPTNSGFKCINYDIRHIPNHTDVVGDVRDLNMFLDEYFDYILASDILEHAPIVETGAILKEWRRVLKKGGIIEFRVPDLETICKEYLRHKDAKYTSWCLYGAQTYSGNYHFVCFDRPWLKTIVESLGFKEVEYKSEGNNFIMKAKKL